jgi:hypothetical protein
MTTKAAKAKAGDIIALTLKVDRRTYVRLSTLRAKEGSTVQDILTEALEQYLTRKRA